MNIKRASRIYRQYWLMVCFMFNFTLHAQVVPKYYYVSLNGKDANPGTELLPWKTFAKAASMATAGTTVFIRQGIYKERLVPVHSGTAYAPVTFSSYPGERATIDGINIDPDNGSWVGLIAILYLSHINIHGLNIKNSVNSGIEVAYCSNLKLEQNYIDSTKTPGMRVGSSDYIEINGNEVVHTSLSIIEEGISVNLGNHIQVKNNRVHDIPQVGIDLKVGCTNSIICNNETYHILSSSGIYLDSWNQHEYNIDVYDNCSHGNWIGFAVCSEQGGLLDKIRVFHNIAYNNYAGFLISSVPVEGMSHPIKNLQIYNNISFGNHSGVHFNLFKRTDLDSIAICNNILYRNRVSGIRILEENGPSGTFFFKNIYILNNIIYKNGYGTITWDSEKAGINIFQIIPQKMQVRNNIISDNFGGAIYVSKEVPLDSLKIAYNFVNGFKNNPYETIGTNALLGNPLFIDTLSNNYHLQATSPAIDKGDPVPVYNDPEDAAKPGFALYPSLGTTRNDMGAYGGPYAAFWDPKSYAAVPSAPKQLLPANEAIGVPTTLLLCWDGAWGTISYRLQVSAKNDFSTTLVDSLGIMGSSFSIKNLRNNTEYYWRVSATNAGGTGSFSGAWTFTTTGVDLVEKYGKIVPGTDGLEQNYPNPFSQNTTIPFYIRKKGHVKLTIINSSGREVEALVNQELAPGRYSTKWTPVNVAAGAYYYRLQMHGFSQSKKLVLEK